MRDIIAAVLLLLGALFMLLASIGILRLPDLFTRMSGASKGSTLGTGLALAAVGVHFSDAQVTARAVTTIIFVFLTVPVAAHMVGRAGYLMRVPISERTRVDELRGRYTPNSQLEGAAGPPGDTPGGPTRQEDA